MVALFPYYIGVAFWLAVFVVGISEGILHNRPKTFFILAATWPIWLALFLLIRAGIQIADLCGVDPKYLYPKNHPRRKGR